MGNERKIQVVAGGTSGMGLATAKALGKFGPVVIGGRNVKRMEDALEVLKSAGIEAYGKSCDISDMESMKSFAEYAASLGTIGNAVNAAAVDAGGMDLILNINIKGTVNFVEAFLPYMNGSKLVNYSSITGYFYAPGREELEIWNDPTAPDLCQKIKAVLETKEVHPGMAHLGMDYIAYSASKRFTMYFTQANAKRFGQKNSQIFSVAPGAFDTPMLREQSDGAVDQIAKGTALGRLGDPDEMSDFIVHLLEDGHNYLTGCDLILDGGKSAMAMVKQLD
ncbi:MAG: SDR family oxidoreductase [Clostridiales bacterium]|nr:SDR family oxidoreductase [Clostridiales bacterium]